MTRITHKSGFVGNKVGESQEHLPSKNKGEVGLQKNVPASDSLPQEEKRSSELNKGLKRPTEPGPSLRRPTAEIPSPQRALQR